METIAAVATSSTSTRNACKLCAPLGASVVFKGIKNCLPVIHGAQGCATYIRRYMISHYKEPVDIASTNFSEATTIFGGTKNLNSAIDNIISQYHPEVIGIASACLSETIGEDIPMMIRDYQKTKEGQPLPVFVHASTPSYDGSHIDGFHEAVMATVASLAESKHADSRLINIFPGFISPEDIRHLKEILFGFGLDYILFPDYSDTLDNPIWLEYQVIPKGGTSIEDLRRTGSSRASIEFGYVLNKGKMKNHSSSKATTAAGWLHQNFNIPVKRLGLPIGIKETDRFFKVLEELSGKKTPESQARLRGRLIDAYVDGHKYLFGKRAIVFGEEDLVIGIVSLLEEIGIETVLVASGGESGLLKKEIERITGDKSKNMMAINGMDFETINEMAEELRPDIMIGNSKGYYIARRLGIPLIRMGFPIHDRIGGQRVLHLCYEGTLRLFDQITNGLIEYKQEHSPVGYKYI
ncbi:MAG: nitrogenase [Mariniphaga sp.]|nr:nitrogenase [Mariniphaga sp.]